MDKAKRKRKIGDSANYLWPRRFEFVSPFSVEECASRLETKDNPQSWFYPTRIVIDSVDGDTLLFEITRGVRGDLRAHGYLKRWDDTTTLVTGEVGINPVATFIITPFILGVIIVVGIGLSQNRIGAVGFGLFLGLLGWIAWYFTKIESDFVFYLIEDALNSFTKSQ